MIVHILKMCTFFCARFVFFFLFLTGVELETFFPSEILMGCLVCVICNSNSINAFIFKRCIMSVHTLKICTDYFCKLFHFFSFLMGIELRYFSHRSVHPQHFSGAKIV